MSALIRSRQRITKKTCGFFLPSERIELLPFFTKKQLISGDKKTFKKTSLFWKIKKNIFSSYVFFLLVFFVVLINFFLNGTIFFYFVALMTFSRNLSNVFFIRSHVFLLNVFLPPSLARFFLIWNREIKQSGLKTVPALKGLLLTSR